MAESPPKTPPQQSQSHESNPQNPNPVSDSEDNPSQKSQPSTPETQNPVSDDLVQPENETNLIHPENEPENEPELVGDDEQDQNDDDDQEPENPESEGMHVSHSPTNQSTMLSTIKGGSTSRNVARKTKRKKKGCSQRVLQRKLEQFSQGFNPIPFVPGKSLDFAKYEEFLRKLGLWDFAHVEFDRDIRVDLVGKLILSYIPNKRGGYVNGLKIAVTRADLGRALKLPVPPPKKLDCDVDEFPQEFLSFLEEFVSNWMLLHEDVWCTPNEVLTWTKMIQDGSPDKVDWAGLIWYMVEKELSQKATLKDCYYASHLQKLMKDQKVGMFMEEPNEGVEILKVEGPVSKETVALDDDEDGSDAKMMDAEESGQKSEEQSVELSLGQDYAAQAENVGGADKAENVDGADKVEKDNDDCDAGEIKKVEGGVTPNEEGSVGISESVGEGSKVESMENSDHLDNVVDAEMPMDENVQNKDIEMMDFPDYNGEEQEQGQWFLDGKIGGQHFLQRCSTAGNPDMKVSEDRRLGSAGEDVEDDEGEEDGHVEGFKIMSKGPLDVMTSANLMQAFETGQLPYSSSDLGGHSPLELMSGRADNNMMLGGPSTFNNAGKREIDHEHDVIHHGLNDNHKRMRVDGNWNDKPPEFNICMEQIQQWVEKAKMCYMATQEEAYQQTSMAQQYFEQQLSEKENQVLQMRYQIDELERNKQASVNRLNRELYLMNSVIDGYRKALKQTQKAFSEYRKQCQVPDEPIYKDAGLGGVVKSVKELERERLRKEEENRMMRILLEGTFRESMNDYEVKWNNEILPKVQSLESRLMYAVKEVELVKDYHVKSKTSVDVPNEHQDHYAKSKVSQADVPDEQDHHDKSKVSADIPNEQQDHNAMSKASVDVLNEQEDHLAKSRASADVPNEQQDMSE